MSFETQIMVTLAVVLLVVAIGGTLVVQQVRWRRKQQRQQADKAAEVFMAAERLRLAVNTKRVLTEVDEYLKEQYPKATRQVRKTVAKQYRKSIISA